jgi:hypothetical protein
LNEARDSWQFVLHHLPAIARKYVHVWGLELIPVDDNDVILQHLLRQIDDQIRKLINYSNQAPVAQLRTSGALPMDSSRTNASTMKNKANLPAQDEVEPPPNRMRPASTLALSNLPGAVPSRLKAVELKDTTLNELAAVEHCLWLLQQQQLQRCVVAKKIGSFRTQVAREDPRVSASNLQWRVKSWVLPLVGPCILPRLLQNHIRKDAVSYRGAL